MLNPSAAARAQGILWTRPHLAELCDSIRQSIEALAGEDARDDAPSLDAARARAHQIAYTLDALNVEGAAALAHALAGALDHLSPEIDEAQATAVLEAVAILPNYLERIETGAPDTPAVLADRIEELDRISGGNHAIGASTSASAGDALDALDPGPPQQAANVDPEALRRAWQRALRDWLMNPADSNGLIAVTEQMTQSEIRSIRCVGTVAGAVFAALADGHLDASPEINKRLAGIDGLLRHWAADGAGEGLDADADGTSRELLGHLRAARPGLAVVDRLVGGTPDAGSSDDAEELARARSVLSGRNRELFTAVAEAARGELNQAKDALNANLLGTNSDAPDIAAQTALLQSVSQSLGMLGLNRLAERVNDQAGRLGELTNDPDSPVLLDVARELLLVDSELEESVLYLGEAPRSELLEGDGEHLPKAEHRRVMRQVLSETLDDLNQAKHLLDQLHRGQGSPDSSEQAHGTLERLAGVLRMAGLDEAAELIEASARSVREERVGPSEAASDRQRLDALAESLIVTEFYLDSLTRLDDRGPDYLKAARHNLIELGYIQPATEAVKLDAGDSAETAPVAEPEAPIEASDDDTTAGAIDESSEFDFEHFESEAATDEPGSTSESAEAGEEVGMEFDVELDPFSGESSEASTDDQGVSSAESSSAEEPTSEEVSFDFDHFEAADDSDTGTDREDVSTSEETASPSDATADLQSHETAAEPDAEREGEKESADAGGLDFEGFDFSLDDTEAKDEEEPFDGPSLEFDGGLSFEPDTEAASADEPEDSAGDDDGLSIDFGDDQAEDRAEERPEERSGDAEEAPADRGDSEGQETTEESPAEVEEPVAATEEASALAGDDFDLTEIFLEEFDEVLEGLNEGFPRWREQLDDRVVLADIRRSFHTLKGSGRMAGAEEIGEFAWAFEQVLNQTLDDQFRAEDVVELIGEAIAALPSLRNRLVGEPADLDEAAAQALVERAEHIGSEQSLPELEGLDSQLIQLMIKEISDHLETIDTWIAASRNQGWAATVDRDLIRSVHTIKGTLRLAPIGDESESMQLIEEYLQELADTDAQARDEAVELIEDMRAMLGKRLDRLNHQAVSTDHFQTEHLAEQARGLISGLHRRDADDAAWSEQHHEFGEEAPQAEETAAASDDTTDLEAADEAVDVGDEAAEPAFGTLEEAPSEPETEAEDPTGAFADAEDEAEDDLSLGFDDEPATETAEASEDEEAVEDELFGTSGFDIPEAEASTDEASSAEEESEPGETGDELETFDFAELEPETESSDSDAVPETAADSVDEDESTGATFDEPFESVDDALTADADALFAAEDEADSDEMVGELVSGDLGSTESAEEAAAEHASETESEPEPEFGAETGAEAPAEFETELEPEPEATAEPEPEPEAPVELEFEAWPEAQVGQLDVPEAAPERTESAEPVAAAASGATIAVDYASLDDELVDLFAEEGQELLEHSDDLLQQWRENPTDRGLVTALQRDVHTIKGSARMAGLNPIGEVAHVLEDLLENIAGGQEQATSERIDTLETGCDHLHAMVDAVTRRDPLPARAAGDAADAIEPAVSEDAAQATPAPEAEEETVRQRASTIRLASERVEELLNFAGEISIFRSRIEQEFGSYRGNISEIDQTVARLREQLRNLEAETEAQILSRYEREHGPEDEEFDPLELDRYSTIQQLSRALAESVSDLNSLTELMDNTGRQAETLLMQQARVTTELQEGLMQARMVAFTTLAPRLRRVVRNAARDAGRKAELHIVAEGEGELDRNVLDRMTAPIEHILRNAIAHGIETPEARRAAGKSETGRIQIEIDREATELLIRVSDDGAGLNLEKIRSRALAQGLITDDQADDPDELSQVILRSGFSTADEVSKLAGRGVGMDVVSAEVRQVGGRISVHTDSGEGTQFTLRIPLSLAVMQAIFVQAAERLFAIPLQAVRGVARIRPDEWQDALEGDGLFRYGGQDYPLLELEPQLGFEPDAQEEGASLSLLMIATGDQRAAIRVTEIQGHREIVLKPVGPQISSIPGILGGTIMGDGNVVVLLDMAPLIERAIRDQRLPGMIERHDTTSVESEEVKRAPLVMVVDDSITMRRVTSRILEHNGMEVLTARDGVEAVDLLFERVPDLMLLDIEMPRMDGFELAAHVRDDARLQDVPIMMITSRSGDKHRERAKKLGVDRYLIKPYQETNLMRNVFEMLDLPDPEA